MKRSDLNAAERRTLSKLVGRLFDGAVVALPDSKAGVKFLCFCMVGEALPEVPLGQPALSRATGLFISGESYIGGRLDSRTWLGTGPLDEILVTLEAFGGDVRELLKRFQRELDVRAPMGAKADAPFDLSRSPVGKPPEAEDDLRDRADAEFEAYEFGGDCRVEAHNGWERAQTDGEVEFSKVVYVRFDDDAPNSDSHKVGFTVLFSGGKVEQVSACLTRSGDDIGERGSAPAERQRG